MVANVVVVGAQWGDEGKGKITDMLAEKASWVVRYQGGVNAGHTVIAHGKTFKLHLVPSGILYPHARCVIGSGTVIDPVRLREEIDGLLAQGLDLSQLSLASNAHVTMPYHRLLDGAEEARRGDLAIGTTGRGIGPTYTDKVNRSGIRVGDLLDPARLRARLAPVLELKNLILEKVYGLEPLSFEAVVAEYLEHGVALAPYVADAGALLEGALAERAPILFEGAQGTLLDLDAGTYPFVTSSHPVAGGACVGTGLGPTAIDRVIGVTKAYTTRVGAGPFPTEDTGAVGEALRVTGREWGTTTGRPRRCGWFDAVIGRLAARVNGLDGLAITKLDVLDALPEIRICVAYDHAGERLERFPADPETLAACTPIYERMPGWQTPTSDCRTMDDLPPAARRYLARLSELVGVPLSLVAVGASREQTIVIEDPLAGPRRPSARA